MQIYHDPHALSAIRNSSSRPIVLVPTMGALHQGHIALIHRAREIAGPQGRVVVSLFVNPTQFNNAGDFDSYPHTPESDLAICRAEGVDAVFAPRADGMYEHDHSIRVIETSLTEQLCGATRPGHFDGVCTVVLKLFLLTGATDAVFGKKDYQQLAIVNRMVRDLNVPIKIHGVETVREPDGLALSSRNTLLLSEHRHDAARIRRALIAACDALASGQTSSCQLIKTARDIILESPHEPTIDYLEIVDAANLSPQETVAAPCVLATAVFYGKVRLIDNIELTPRSAD